MEKTKEKTKDDKKYKISFLSFMSMIFITVYGIANAQQVYYQMGYASITYLIIAAIFFFIPYCFIVAEMSSAFKDRHGGIFSWMTESVGEKFGLVGTMIWYGSFVVMWFSASIICVQISVAIFGKDTTANWHMFGLTSPEILALIGAVYMIIAAYVSTRGIKRMTFLSNIAIVTVIIVHLFVLGGGIAVLFLQGFHVQQGFNFTHLSSYFYGPNPGYSSFLPALGFLVFTFFAYGGMENISGMVDKVENSKKNVPKAIVLSCIGITVLYIVVVLISGVTCNWEKTFGSPKVNLANYSIYLTQQEFYRLGTLVGMDPSHALLLGQWVNRIISIMALIFVTSIPLRIYSPIKHMFEGMPKGMVPDKMLKINKHGVAGNAIIFQTIVVVFFVLLLGFGGGSVSSLFNKLTLMTFVAGSVPYVFIVFAYIKFKANDNIKKEYQFFNKKLGIIVASICFIVLAFTNVYAIIEPSLMGNPVNSLWIGGGPVLFAILAILLDIRYRRRIKKGIIKVDKE